jgi:hypothetical protein
MLCFQFTLGVPPGWPPPLVLLLGLELRTSLDLSQLMVVGQMSFLTALYCYAMLIVVMNMVR